MKLVRRSQRLQPSVSLVLLDWSVRESFHLLHYLRQQEVPRDAFEVILIEYYSTVSPAAERYASEIDTWAVLEMPEQCYYHKHLMYNAGIALSRGEICVFCDSDAMVRPTFVGAILKAFDEQPGIVLHLDQFRNMRRDLHPFSFPSFDDVLGPGCINNVDGRTRGVADSNDPLHERNYGACMCARRADLIAVGGADEHIDYLGHICGPYDMTFRLVNLGRHEVWHESEFMYHTWHPGQAGVANYLGPHDGRHMSTTALDALATARVEPLEINPAIAALRVNDTAGGPDGRVLQLLIPPERATHWRAARLQDGVPVNAPRPVLYRGYCIEPSGRGYIARLILSDFVAASLGGPVTGQTEQAVRKRVDATFDNRLRLASAAASVYVLVWRGLAAMRVLAKRGLRVCWNLLRRIRRPSETTDLVPATGNLLPSLSARATDRWSRFLMETRYFAAMIASLLANVYVLGQIRRTNGDATRPAVIVDRAAVSFCLRLLSALGLLARVNIIRIASSAELSRWLSSASMTDWQGYVVVDRDLYMRHYVKLSALRGRHQLVVA